MCNLTVLSSFRKEYGIANYEVYPKVSGLSLVNETYAYNNKHSLRSNAKVMAAKLARLTHRIAIQLHLVAESCTICSSRSRRPVRKLLVTPSYASAASSTFEFKTNKTEIISEYFWTALTSIPEEKRTGKTNYQIHGYSSLTFTTIGECVQKFPDWSPEARTANGTSVTKCSCIAIL
jgi:hypothetical protein